MRIKLIISMTLITYGSAGQSTGAEKAIKAGNDFYKQEKFNKAAIAYNKALQADPSNTIARFNQANTTYKQDQKVEAAKMYTELTREAAGTELRSKAFYNKGVILSKQKNLEESIEAYKNTLRLNTGDQQARENLQKALLELKKKTPPKKENEQQKKKKEQEQQKKQQQPKMSPKEAEQRLKQLQQKEKEVQQRLQKEKNKTGGSQPKDW